MVDDTFDKIKRYSVRLSNFSDNITNQISSLILCHRQGKLSVTTLFDSYEPFLEVCGLEFEGIEKDKFDMYFIDLESLDSDKIRVYTIPKGKVDTPEEINITGYYFDRSGKKILEKKYIGPTVYRYDTEGKLVGKDKEEWGGQELWTGPREALEVIKQADKINPPHFSRKVNKDQSYAILCRKP